ncbi:MAG: hypothetical protein P4N60_00765 [Verrucomicrobiae bacterium]|nr:hypothetical protein [Verrucomicrobiae bacterium]
MKQYMDFKVAEPASPQPKCQLPQNVLVFVSQRLLTEKCSVTADPLTAGMPAESFTIRADMVTGYGRETPGYNHYGINE